MSPREGKKFWKGRGRNPFRDGNRGRLVIPSPVYHLPSCGPLQVQVGLIQPGTSSSHGVCILNLDFLSSLDSLTLQSVCNTYRTFFSSHRLLCESPSMEMPHPPPSFFRSYIRHHLLLEALLHCPLYFLLGPLKPCVFPIFKS